MHRFGLCAVRVVSLFAITIPVLSGGTSMLGGAASLPVSGGHDQPPSADTYRITGLNPADVVRAGRCRGEARWLVLPDAVLAQASRDPPLPLFRESFRTLARAAIAPKWRPKSLADAKFAAIGEGAFRARTARMFKIYDRGGTRVILQGFAGRVVLIAKPPPFSLPAEADSLIERYRRAPEPWGGAQPYGRQATGPDPSVAGYFQAIRRDVLTAAAQPISEQDWQQSLRYIAVMDGWLWLTYRCKPFRDPGAAPSSGSCVHIWTDGKVLRVVAQSTGDPNIELEESPLYRALRPTVDVAVKLLPGVSKVATLNEWTNSDKEPVPTLSEATHQCFYISLSKERLYRAWVPLANTEARLQEAQWVVLAWETRSHASHMNAILRNGLEMGRIAESRGRQGALDWVSEQREQIVCLIESFQQLPPPESMAEAYSRMVDALGADLAFADAALSKWREALTKSSDVAIDYRAVDESIRLTLDDELRHEIDLKTEAGGAVREALRTLGMVMDEDIYTTL